MSGRHTGVNIANVIIVVLDQVKITSRVNAENNTKMIEELENLFHKRELFDFVTKEHQVHCFPHTVNISTGHVVKALTSAPNEQEPPNNHVPSTTQTYEQAVARNPITMAHAAICVIHILGACQEAFTKVIEEGNKDGRFKDFAGNSIKLKQLQLLHDVPTCWDSVYYMIQHF